MNLQGQNVEMSPGFGPATFDEVTPSPSPLLVGNNYERDSGPASSNVMAQEALVPMSEPSQIEKLQPTI